MGENLTIQNASNKNLSFEWDFCSGDLDQTLNGSSVLNYSLFFRSRSLRIEQDKNGDWFGFTISVTDNKMIRLEFGNKLSNVPNVVDLGNPGNLLKGAYDFKLFRENGRWYALVANTGNNDLLLFSFGESLLNSPSSQNLGGFGLLNTPNGIFILEDNDSIYAFLSNGSISEIIKLNFGSSINNIPTAESFAVSGGSGLRGLSLIKDCDKWYGIALSYSNNKAFRMSFINGINSNPDIGELTIPSLSYNFPANISLAYDGSVYFAYIQSALGSIYKINFGNSIADFIGVGSDLGNFELSSSNFPLELVRSESDWYLFNINQNGRTLNRFDFSSTCSSDPSYSSQFIPSVNFTTSGTHKITLTAKDENGNITSKTKSILVTSSEAPTIDFDFNKENCITTLNTFSASLTSPNTITSWQWDFGDGQTAIGQEVSHQYAAPGTYTVRLSVESENDCGNFIEKEVTIHPEPEPDFNFPGGVICTNGEVAFENTTPGDFGDDITWSWDFGDGNSVAEKSPSHTYSAGGQYTVSLTADIPGCSVTKSYQVDVLTGPSVNFTASNFCFGQEVQFADLTQGDGITSYHWDFGNGTTSDLQNPSVKYDLAGVYEVTLSVENDPGCSNSFTRNITIQDLPVVDFAHEQACAGSPVQFFDRTTNAPIQSWFWDFGHTTANEEDPVVAFDKPGEYTVKLITTSASGCVDSVSKVITVTEGPVASFSAQMGCPGELTRFTDTSTDPGGNGITSWFWEIDGITYFEQHPEVTFDRPGTYQASLTVTSGSFCQATIQQQIVVDSLPQADFEYSAACVGEPVAFNDLSKVFGMDKIIAWRWSFGDTATSDLQNPELVFNLEGDLPVSLSVTLARGCTVSVSKVVRIHGLPKAAFAVQKSFGAPPFRVNFENNSSGATQYQWFFNDLAQSTSNVAGPSFEFSEVGDYEVKLIAMNDAGCTDTTSAIINVLIPVLDAGLEQIFSIDQAGDLQLVLKITNQGSITLSDMDILLDMGGLVELKEPVSTSIGAGETVNHILSIVIPKKDIPGISYVCATLATNDPGFVEENTDDNKLCLDINSKLVLLEPYPNPASGQLNISFILPEKKLVTLELYNAQGAKVMDQALTGTRAGLNEYQHNLTYLQKGVYLLKVSYKGKDYLRRVQVQ